LTFLGAMAQPLPAPVQNVVQLSANAALDEPQDWLSVTLGTTRDGADPHTVQDQLKTALDAALNEARLSAQAGAMEVHTGQFSLVPRYGRDGRISGWKGSVELLLSGRDFTRIGSTAGNIQGLTVVGVVFSLSREQRARVEALAQALAIERFKARAGEIARGFGFAGFTLREVSVLTTEQGLMSRPRQMSMEASVSRAEAPLPLEAGKATVQVTVSGSVQLK